METGRLSKNIRMPGEQFNLYRKSIFPFFKSVHFIDRLLRILTEALAAFIAAISNELPERTDEIVINGFNYHNHVNVFRSSRLNGRLGKHLIAGCTADYHVIIRKGTKRLSKFI